MKALIVTADQLQRGDWLVGFVFDTAVGKEPMTFPKIGQMTDGYRGQPGRRYIICRPGNDDEEAVA